ncbi:MAG: sulfotransferase family 2 domain-containing protein [Nitrosomonadales bacterium]|nr:sulfotransferase family 2 domain-containing protein [Nitrosomonadales bacterium]
MRNPFDRALSHYEHIRRDHHHYFHERVTKQGSLLAFLRDPITQPLIKNFQVRSLSAIFEPAQLLCTLDKIPAQKYPLEQYLETADSGLDDSQALLLAKDFLSRCIFVGITERMQESVDKLAKVLEIPNNHHVERLNTSPSKSAIDYLTQEEWLTLADLLYADWELYEYGLKTFQSFN